MVFEDGKSVEGVELMDIEKARVLARLLDKSWVESAHPQNKQKAR